MLRAAVAHYRRQQRITTAALASANRLWRRGDLAGLTVMVTLAQQTAAQDAAAAVPLMLAEQGMPVDPLTVITSAFAGIASDGRGLASLLEVATTRRQLQLIVATQMQDAARVSAGVAIAARPKVTGYIRMLNPPSCNRCVVLAGKWFKWNAGFERHPKCDCRHVPAAEDQADDLRTHPDQYFDSLTPAEQDAAFGKAGAQAIRDGADIGQVVNARAGMTSASIGGRNVRITTVGTTRRGHFAHTRERIDRERGVATQFVETNVGRRGRTANYIERRTVRPRLMPEQIYLIAGDDRVEARRLLAGNGYIVGTF